MKNQERSASLDALRGILALAVFVGHVWMGFVAPTNGSVATPTHVALMVVARLAVVLFFLLSGYVIAQSIDVNRQRNGAFRLGDFAMARVFRIVPPMLLVVVVTVLLHAAMLWGDTFFVASQSAERLVFHTRPVDQLLALASLTLAGDLSGGFNGPIWSLIMEIRLYVLAGLIALATRRPWVLLVAAAYAVLIFLPDGTTRPQAQGAMFACFGIGAAAYALRRSERLLPAGLALGAVLLATAWPLELMDAYAGLNDPDWLAMQVAAAAAFAPVMIALGRSPRFGALHWLGRGSYTLYILHFPVLQAIYFPLYNLAHPLVAEYAQWTAPVAGVVAFAFCVALGVWVERPKEQRAWFKRALASLRRSGGAQSHHALDDGRYSAYPARPGSHDRPHRHPSPLGFESSRQ